MISVIIPTLNEEQTIRHLIDDLQLCEPITQIIVVDGGSSDETRVTADNLGAKVIGSERGKAIQMNKGAANATNDHLLFLHADSRISAESLNTLQQAIHQYEAGCFYLEFDKNGWLYSVYTYFSRFNSTLFTYGDQGLFVRKNIFQQVGGYTEIPIMEDIDMVQKIKRVVGFKKLNVPIITSARRFESVGIIKQQLINICLVLLYKCGVKPKVLKKYYPY